MGRARQVTPAGRARGTATITAVTATAAVLLAGCGTPMAAQPPLWGDSGLEGAARRLLHIKPGLQ
jgi:hypothetical protein